jgi:hypothetical protein
MLLSGSPAPLRIPRSAPFRRFCLSVVIIKYSFHLNDIGIPAFSQSILLQFLLHLSAILPLFRPSARLLLLPYVFSALYLCFFICRAAFEGILNGN